MNQIWRVFVPFVDMIEVRVGEVVVTMNEAQVGDLLEVLLKNPRAEDRAVSLLADKLDARYRLLRELDEKNRIEEAAGLR